MSIIALAMADDLPEFRVLKRQFLLAMRIRNCSDQTIANWSVRIDRFTAWCAERGITTLAEVTPQVLAAYQRWLYHYCSPKTHKPLKFNTQLSYLMPIKQWFIWLANEQILPVNVAGELELPKEEKENEHTLRGGNGGFGNTDISELPLSAIDLAAEDIEGIVDGISRSPISPLALNEPGLPEILPRLTNIRPLVPSNRMPLSPRLVTIIFRVGQVASSVVSNGAASTICSKLSSSSSSRLEALPPSARRVAPWLVGLAERASERRKSWKPGTSRSTSSSRFDGALASRSRGIETRW